MLADLLSECCTKVGSVLRLAPEKRPASGRCADGRASGEEAIILEIPALRDVRYLSGGAVIAGVCVLIHFVPLCCAL